MPRPGQRPYECVRRAWHSERQQPMRGSLVQEIFRVVNEIHGSSTRRNKEWQEKLPVVVLKAEEIIYSKANSEAEYMDLSTLLDRTNDAIDTIIRRDESTETGQPLHPCIEAALTLGCTPKRASRSQRNDGSQRYLRQSTWELVESSPGSIGRLADRGVVPDSTNSGKVRCFPLCLGNGPSSSPLERVPQRLHGLDSSTWSYSGYPLYPGNSTQFVRDACGFELVGNESGAPCSLPARIITDASEEPTFGRTRGLLECDLSLRLGPNPVPGTNAEDIPKDTPAWCSNKRSFLDEHLNGDQGSPFRKRIVNAAAAYGYPREDRRPHYAPTATPPSRRDGLWRNPAS